VRGPLNAPTVEIAPILTGVFRVTDGVLNLGKSGLGAGISIAEGGVNVAKEMGPGALNVGKKLLGGLFDTGKGLATLDTKQVEKGLVGSTVGTIDLSLGAVWGGRQCCWWRSGQIGFRPDRHCRRASLEQGYFNPLPNRHAAGTSGPCENALSASYPMIV
jgi:hypothetical protein